GGKATSVSYWSLVRWNPSQRSDDSTMTGQETGFRTIWTHGRNPPGPAQGDPETVQRSGCVEAPRRISVAGTGAVALATIAFTSAVSRVTVAFTVAVTGAVVAASVDVTGAVAAAPCW